MITIESIRLRNFRAIREAYFRPLNEGISGIFGSNGAGKTTILAGVIFALFGGRPPGTSVGSLRRAGASVDDECSVSVVFQHLGQQVEVIREIAGKNNRSILAIYVDGVEASHTSVGSGDRWIKERLGVDLTGFLTAFVVRQKELDQLVTARPAERKTIIERLAGIETINEALKAARKDENAAKSVLDTLPGSEEAVTAAESEVLNLARFLENEETAFQQKSARVGELRERHREVNQTLKTHSETAAKQQQLLSRLQALSEMRAQLEATLEHAPDGNESEADLRAKFDTLTTELQAVDAEREQTSSSLHVAAATHQQSLQELENAKNRLAQAEALLSKNETTGDVEALKEAVVTAQQQIDMLKDTIASDSARLEDYRSSLEQLHDHTECPTCHTVLTNPEVLIASLKENVERLEESIASKREQGQQLVAQKNAAEEEVQQALNRDLLLQEKANLTEAIAGRTEQIAGYSPAALQATLQELTERREGMAEEQYRLRKVLEDYERVAAAKRRLFEVENETATLEKENAAVAGTLPPAATLQQFQNELEQLVSTGKNLAEEVKALELSIATGKTRLDAANRQYKLSVDQWKRKEELYVAQEQRALTTELLDKFRQETVAALAPELSEHATDLIGEITNGAFTRIVVDEDFNITVYNSEEVERKTSELSGGEESAVALSLRLAIGLLITGRSPGLLWLDEVLTAQDAERRQSMLSTIRSLPYSQIVMINHTTEAADIVDKAVTIIPDVVDGSRLMEDTAAAPGPEEG